MQKENKSGIVDSVTAGIKQLSSKKRLILALIGLIVILGAVYYALTFFGLLGGAGSSHVAVQTVTGNQKEPGGDIQIHPTHKTPAKKTNSHTVQTHKIQPAKKIGPFFAQPTIGGQEPLGVAFVRATITPIKRELNRFWGWRPNDIIEFTDNVNNFQLGVLEVTRRTAEVLAEKLSRPGAAAAFDKHLENARSRFMNQADKFWFSSAESDYSEGIEELEAYMDKLQNGGASFYSRTDNLIPLLAAYEQLLGSCDENLVKPKEDNGRPVSFFKADDYFYQAVGVASAIHTILLAIQQDFAQTITTRDGMNSLHHAIESCERAISIDPWIILDGDLGGLWAHHRSNLAGPISHARFYIGLLARTLST